LTGSIDNQPEHFAGPLSGGTFSSTAGILGFADNEGYLVVPGDSFQPGVFLSPEVLVQLPPGVPDPRSWFCAIDAPITAIGEPMAITSTLHDLRRLGACPGTPVTGQLVDCDPVLGCAGGQIQGQLGANDFTIQGAGSNALPGLWESNDLPSGGVLVLRWPSIGATGAGMLRTPNDTSDPGAVYCIGSAVIGAGGKVTLSDVSRLGTCAEAKPVAGELSVCVNY
jgi:hypothetical protein